MRGGLTDVQRVSKLLERPQNVQRLIDLLSDAEPESEKEHDAARK